MKKNLTQKQQRFVDEYIISGNATQAAKNLTQKQQRFVDEYIISGNATQAAIKAGYSKKTAKQSGAENLAKPYLKAAIEKRNAEIQSEKTADMTEVMEYLTSVMRGEQTESVATAKGIYDDNSIRENS